MPTGYPNKPKIPAGPIAGIDVSALISQVNSIAADYASSSADAAKWRQLLEYLEPMGYGPNISPANIIYLMPSAVTVLAISQESAAAPAPKRRKVAPGSSVSIEPGPYPGNGADPGHPELSPLEA